MADRNLMAQYEIDGMAAVPDTGREPWATRLQGPHPQHVSVAAGALMTVTSSRTHAYMLAYTLADAGLLVPVSGSDGEQDTAGPLSDDLVPKIERVITGYSSPPPARVLAWAVADLIRSHRSVPVADCELQANSKPNQNLELADSDLRDRIAQYLHTAQCAGSDANPFDCRKADHWQDWRDLADITMAAVAPVLADRDTALEKAHINATRHARLAEAHRRQEEEVEQAKTELAKLAPFDKWESPPSLMDWVHMVRLELAARANQVDYMRWLHAEAMHHLGQAGDYIRVTREVQRGVCVECLCAGGIHKTWCKTGPVAGDTEPSEQAEPWKCGECKTINLADAKSCELCLAVAGPVVEVAPATPTEPRVWRKGDPEPPASIEVLVDCKDDHLPYLCRIPGSPGSWQWFQRPADRNRAPSGVPWDEATAVMASGPKDYVVALPEMTGAGSASTAEEERP